MKPDAAIYQAAARNVGVRPKHYMFVDDLEDNVDGARAAGMQAIRFESPARVKQQLSHLFDLGA